MFETTLKTVKNIHKKINLDVEERAIINIKMGLLNPPFSVWDVITRNLILQNSRAGEMKNSVKPPGILTYYKRIKIFNKRHYTIICAIETPSLYDFAIFV